jgi:pyrroline-5-carboxylate reductase
MDVATGLQQAEQLLLCVTYAPVCRQVLRLGLIGNRALAISAQTVKGAAEMLMEEQIHPEQLIDRVTTKAVLLQV